MDGAFIMTDTTIRFAAKQDASLVLRFIKELAVYEKMEQLVVATEADIERLIFEQKAAEVIFICEDGKEVGFALFFHTFSTFLGKTGIHLEDLYVMPEYRGKGYGKALLKKLAQLAVERDCGRLEWSCLDWNTHSIDFYRSLGASQLDNWLDFRLSGDALSKMAE